MSEKIVNTGGFTLPGEAGFEDLTLKLAEKWGADVIRDSDGTQLSDKIITSGYDIYSTICLVRGSNEWAKLNMDKLQQCYLRSYPLIAKGDTVKIDILQGFFKEQFLINIKDNPKEFWQVFDRTTGLEIEISKWELDINTGTVMVKNTKKWHKYTVNFLVYRIWEEISAYNHITNNWGNREHELPIEPMYKETQDHILKYLDQWLIDHQHTKVVRFTSMFYNFWWLWGSDPNLKFIVNDWGAYDFTVNPLSMKLFEKEKGYKMTSEDFVNKGLYNNSYLPPSEKYRDWMDFINKFVIEFGKKCIDLVHKHGKKAYVFYNDHWIGMEPTLDSFKEFGFDGIIDGVFSGFETRKVSGTKGVAIRELRLHPYFFPTGVNGVGTFIEGGDPSLECKTYWLDIRRALLRDCVDRIGFGGYLHLVDDHPAFVDYVQELVEEFREIRELHKEGKPYSSKFKVAILSAWGNMRAWGCRGHFNHGNYYNEIMESISGLPVEVEFISFKDIIDKGISGDIKVIINAGQIDDAWSGGWNWSNEKVIEILTEWVSKGGGLIGVGEPSAVKYSGQYFQMCHVFGVEREVGLTVCFDKYAYKKVEETHFILKDIQGELDFGKEIDNIYVIDKNIQVIADKNQSIQIATNTFGKGRSVYFSGHKYTPENIRILLRAIYWAADEEKEFGFWTCSNANTECAYYPKINKLAVINITGQVEETTVYDCKKNEIAVSLKPYGIKIIDLG
ncbi:1,3-beta-galactosyl-N-acetylhexosamine phosphorylase [Clostridium estertheticum]|uniref:1,3-beta-galactosyl-N-acetylhexosamine phosphorylase n=1 Tax=Clostridium estertheticum TaxID=238834 RepID=UPI001C0D7AEF|nr:1,3-beta-galactosyl-N-acetylhexosamine phosphorylase [Clostridium estertheticum]MBU3072367.1 1,3-beta-galactosyl-N-acetylhexosamine phosphorylase [Clostridium estertheticum]MBU3162460.1 1,3-beta-galactosyl-N-acetylhexosamine phosphorylase [Clostridium estertheticum]MBU3217895.1 1,3-beta-galactosyl-N-acetylhexosamine phosphorylase [Clostridium estertheticum]WAG55703.1 1,3-beta-galactosyl-N-acetylhexosamine phosphorylase [Clostridium estertheticum]